MIGRGVSYDRTNPGGSRRYRLHATLRWPSAALAPLIVVGLHFSAAWAQNPYPDEVIVSSRPLMSAFTLRAERNLVEVRAVVRDGKGRVVDKLRQADFELLDNGKKQEISSFSIVPSGASAALGPSSLSAGSPLPIVPQPAAAGPTERYVLLYFDDLHMDDDQLTFLRQAAEKFVKSVTGPETHFALSTSSGRESLDFTEDLPKLRETIFAVRPRSQLTVGKNECPQISAYQAFLIWSGDPNAFNLALEQGVYCHCGPDADSQCREQEVEVLQRRVPQMWSLVRQESLESVAGLAAGVKSLAARPGQRVEVLVSSGFIWGAPERQLQLNELIDLALHANVVINSLDATGLAPLPSSGASLARVLYVPGNDSLNAYSQNMELGEIGQHAEALEAPADGTGGVVFRNSNDLAAGLQQLADTPEVAYSLAFSPKNLKANGAFHKLAVRVTGPTHYTIEARKGYFAPPKEAGNRPVKMDKVAERAVLGGEQKSEIPVTLTVGSTRGPGALATLQVKMDVDVDGLPFQRSRDRNLEKLTFTTVLLGSNDELVAGKEATMELRLKEKTRQELARTGVTAETLLEAPRGSYRLREVVTESERGLTTVIEQPVNVP